MRNEITLTALCNELQHNCGDELGACKAVGVSLIFMNQWRKDDKVTDERLTEAARVGTQGLYSAAVRRAVEGVPKGIYYRGERVSTETEYSDSLLNTLLQAKLPEFKKGAEAAAVQVNVNVANLMPRATSYDEWLTMKQQTLSKPAEHDASIAALGRLMSPPIEAEYVEVVANPFEGIDL